MLAETTCSLDDHSNPKRWTITIGYRYQPSHRHFVGDVENVSRARLHTEIYNLYHLADIGVERQVTNRWSVFASLPILFAHRDQLYPPSAKYVVNGIGDFSFGARSWVFKPPTESGNNVSIGVSIKAPTGKAGASQLATLNGQLILATADQSIQAGDGGWGVAIDGQGFERIRKIDTEFYMAGVYLFNPMGTSGVPTFRNFPQLHGRESVMSIADQYLVRSGFGHAVPKVRGLAVSFGARWEGVPAHDVFGPSNGFRRPGYAVSLDPGLLYTTHNYTFTLNGPWAVFRDRTRSVPDVQNGIHGDAAFADYTVIVSLGKRF